MHFIASFVQVNLIYSPANYQLLSKFANHHFTAHKSIGYLLKTWVKRTGLQDHGRGPITQMRWVVLIYIYPTSELRSAYDTLKDFTAELQNLYIQPICDILQLW